MIAFNISSNFISNNIPRFLELNSDYTSNFGFQWNLFSKTQIDNESQTEAISKKRFFIETEWKENGLEGLNILEAGSGAGRFTEVLLNYTKANIHSFDYSNAVEANYKTNYHFKDRLVLFQASIYEIPFNPAQFDKVICLGVLQHTPDFQKSITCLCDQIKVGGELIIDFYPIKGWWTKICSKYLLRPFTKKLSHVKLLKLIEINIDWMIWISKLLNNLGLNILTRFIPICDIKNTLPSYLSDKELREWCILDTFDMFSPEFDNPQKISTVKKWVESAGLEVTFADNINYDNISAAVVRALKK